MKLLKYSSRGADVRITTEDAERLYNILESHDWDHWTEDMRQKVRTYIMFFDAIVSGEYERVWDYGEDIC